MIRFSVLGDPKTKGSLRPMRAPNGRVFVKEQMGDALQTWRERLSAIIEPIGRQLGAPIEEPVAVFCHFRFAPPKKQRWAWPVAKGRNDPDKLARTCLDHLSGVLLADDAQVALLVSTKSYGVPGVDVVIEELSALIDPDHHGKAYVDLAALMLEALGHVDVLTGGEVNPSAGGGSVEGVGVALPQGSP